NVSRCERAAIRVSRRHDAEHVLAFARVAIVLDSHREGATATGITKRRRVAAERERSDRTIELNSRHMVAIVEVSGGHAAALTDVETEVCLSSRTVDLAAAGDLRNAATQFEV